MRTKMLAVLIVGALATLAWAQPMPGGTPGVVQPVPPERLETALAQEMEWLSGLAVEAPGWDKALSALQEAFEELQASEGTPSPETLVRLNSALHLVIDLLERTAFQQVRARTEEAQQGLPEWLEEYLDEATADMGAEDAARVRAIVQGLFRGSGARVGESARERLGGERPAGPRGQPELGPTRVRQEKPEERKAWIEGYLAGATAGMSPEQAARVRGICRGAIRAGWEFRQEQQETRQDNLRHFLRLRGISAGLDMMILRTTGE